MIPVGTKVRVKALGSSNWEVFNIEGEVTSHQEFGRYIYNTVKLPSGASMGFLDEELDISDD